MELFKNRTLYSLAQAYATKDPRSKTHEAVAEGLKDLPYAVAAAVERQHASS
jgi:hypothetical protein